jgi:hypothetical protein
MIDLETVTRFVMENFEQVQISNGGKHFLARCRLCGDSKKNKYKKRFNLDWNDGVPGWNCFNCNRHGNFYELYSRLKGISYDDAKKELYKYDKDKVKRYIKERTNRPQVKKKNKRDSDNFNWIRSDVYERLGSIPENLGVMENMYLKKLEQFYNSRKIPYEYKIYIAYKGKYKNRIIIPIFDEDNNIIYFQARRIPGSGITPKYDNPVAPKELCILNKHKFDKEKYIIVHEGLIDAFMVGKQGTSCLGKEISEELLQELFKLTNKGVIVALDNDTEAYKSLARFMRKNPMARKVKYFLYPKKFEGYDDINSIVKGSSVELNVYELITQNSVSYSTAYTKLSIQKLLEGKK